MRRRPLLSALSFVTIATVASSFAGEREAHASGYLTARFGADHGTPAAPNAYAIYFNPAALGGTKGTTLHGDLSLALRWVHYQRGADALSPGLNRRNELLASQQYIDANTGHANLLNLLALPFLGVNSDFGTKAFRAGWAVYVPFGGLATWDKREEQAGSPGTRDGVQRWHNISGQILAVYNTFAAAVVLPEGFSVGASVSPVIQHVGTVRARTADDTDEITFPDGSLKEGRSLIDVTGVNVAASAGVYWQGLRENRLKLGLAYLSQPGFGTSRLGGTLEGRVAGGDVKQDVDLLQTWPDVVRFGAAYRLPSDKVELRTDLEFVRWSVFDKQCLVVKGKDCNVADDGSETGGTNDVVINIPRNWNNAIGYRLGAAYFANDRLEIFGSGSFTTSAVPKAWIDASTIDSFRLYGTLGARYELTKKLALAGSYTHIYFMPVDTDGENKFNELRKPSQSPSSDGKYRSQIGFFNVNVAYAF